MLERTTRCLQQHGLAPVTVLIDAAHATRAINRPRVAVQVTEPPWGVEPQTYALRGCRSGSPGRSTSTDSTTTALRAHRDLGERDPSCQNSCQRPRRQDRSGGPRANAFGMRRSCLTASAGAPTISKLLGVLDSLLCRLSGLRLLRHLLAQLLRLLDGLLVQLLRLGDRVRARRPRRTRNAGSGAEAVIHETVVPNRYTPTGRPVDGPGPPRLFTSGRALNCPSRSTRPLGAAAVRDRFLAHGVKVITRMVYRDRSHSGGHR